MTIRTFVVDVTTNGSGAATAYTPPVSGYLQDIQYVKDDFTDGVDFTITGEDSGRTLWTESNVNASAIRAPRQPTHSTAGVASLYASGGEAVNDRIALSRERIKIVIASGGDTKDGQFRVTIAS